MKTDLVQLVRETVPLHAAGSVLFGRCPFHREASSVSLMVHPDRQAFFCDECGAAGNVIDWTMRTKGLTFEQALVELTAKR